MHQKSPQREEGKLIFLCKASVTRFFRVRSRLRGAHTNTGTHAHTHKGNGGRSGLCGGGEWGGCGGVSKGRRDCVRLRWGEETVWSTLPSPFSSDSYFRGYSRAATETKGVGADFGMCAQAGDVCVPCACARKNEASGRFSFFPCFFL